MPNAYMSFWGKADRADGADWHPAACHMLDVAATALAFLEATRPIIPGLPDAGDRYHGTIAFLIALHDIGKFSRQFQQKRLDLWPPCLGHPTAGNVLPRHDSAGYWMLKTDFRDVLAALLPTQAPTERAQLLRAICGHHGRPPDETQSHPINCPTCLEQASAFISDVKALLRPEPFPCLEEPALNAVSWWLAGLTVLADWIGSNESWFPYAPATDELGAYWPPARTRADAAIIEAGIVPVAPRAALATSDLLPSGAVASPLQGLIPALDLGPPRAATLVIIEDQTGSGKTEAALLLAHRLMVEKSARGLFIALPTMATANALYGRLDRLYRTLFDAAGVSPSLILAHGGRRLNARFMASLGTPHAERQGEDMAEDTASAQCAGWIAADRRRAFFADCGVGTIDQALHAVLPTRHAPLRLFGLRDRVLIIDEAHAYDTYMEQELFRLLEFQRRLGGHVIVLSATLPRQTRQKLVGAFGVAVPCTRTDYPLVTVAVADALTETPCEPNPSLSRSIEVIRLADAAAAVLAIAQAAALGAAVGWIRNTVDDAMAACALLREAGVAPILFHARFAMGDRQAIETDVQARVGKSSTAAQRRVVIVSTQVMEQSLDIDFDMLISDLAPVDLLLQRAGRLWRHARPERPVEAGRFYILSPEPVAAPPADWLKDMKGTAAVYRHPALLWRSARGMFAKRVLSLPADVRGLIEAAYAPDAETPTHLQKKSDAAEGADKAASSLAWANLLEWDIGYCLHKDIWNSDVKTPTRLAEPGRIFRLAVAGEGGLKPWFEHADAKLAWALSEISLPFRIVDDAPAPANVAELRKTWPMFDQEIPVLVFTAAGGVWTAIGLDKAKRQVMLTYSSETGLERSD